MHYKKDRLSELAGLDNQNIIKEDDAIESGRRGRGKKAGRRRLFTPNVDEQQGSMNLLGKILDKIDFANVLDKTIGMPRAGFKKGHAIPFDKFDRKSIAQIEEEVVNSLEARGEDPAIFNEMTQDQADDMMRLMDKKKRGERLEPHETDIILGAVGISVRNSLKVPAYVLGRVNYDSDKKYCYYIIDPNHAEAPTSDLSFLAGRKSDGKLLSKTPYPIKPGSPVGDAAISLVKTKNSPDLASLQTALEARLGFDGGKEKLDALVASGDLKITKIKGGLSRWAINNYGSALDDLVQAAKSDPKMTLMVGKDRNHAGYYMGDYIRYLNGLDDKQSDGNVDLYVPSYAGLTLSEAKNLRESILAGNTNLIDLIKEESNSLFQSLFSIGEETGDVNLRIGADDETEETAEETEETPEAKALKAAAEAEVLETAVGKSDGDGHSMFAPVGSVIVKDGKWVPADGYEWDLDKADGSVKTTDAAQPETDTSAEKPIATTTENAIEKGTVVPPSDFTYHTFKSSGKDKGRITVFSPPIKDVVAGSDYPDRVISFDIWNYTAGPLDSSDRPAAVQYIDKPDGSIASVSFKGRTNRREPTDGEIYFDDMPEDSAWPKVGDLITIPTPDEFWSYIDTDGAVDILGKSKMWGDLVNDEFQDNRTGSTDFNFPENWPVTCDNRPTGAGCPEFAGGVVDAPETPAPAPETPAGDLVTHGPFKWNRVSPDTWEVNSDKNGNGDLYFYRDDDDAESDVETNTTKIKVKRTGWEDDRGNTRSHDEASAKYSHNRKDWMGIPTFDELEAFAVAGGVPSVEEGKTLTERWQRLAGVL